MHREIRKDREMPPFRCDKEALSEAWQAYCDDSDYPRVLPLSECEKACDVRDYQQRGRASLDHWGMPRSQKCGVGA